MSMADIDVQPAGVKTVYTYVRLCTAFNEEASLTCDLAAGHEGPHRATLLWNREDEDDS